MEEKNKIMSVKYIILEDFVTVLNIESRMVNIESRMTTQCKVEGVYDVLYIY